MDERKMIALRIQCIGRVQGVFFRASTKEQAVEYELNGWERNGPDGSVSIHAEGEASAVNKLLIWCEKGPQLANVTKGKDQRVNFEGFDSFDVIR